MFLLQLGENKNRRMNFDKIKNSLVLSAMEGINDGNYCKIAGIGASIVTLGGLNCDKESMSCGKPFSPKNETVKDWLKREVNIAKESGAKVAVNIRGTTIESLIKCGKILEEVGADFFELDAHCSAECFHKLGIGHYLVRHPEKLEKWTRELSANLSIPIIIKCATHVMDNPGEFAKRMFNAGASILHFDIRMIKFPVYYIHRPNLKIIKQVKEKTDIFLIVSGTVNNYKKLKKFLDFGADAVGIASATLKDKEIINRLSKEIKNEKIKH
jgi:TIM-barrel protein